MIINPGFHGKPNQSKPLPRGQFLAKGFPVLSLGPTPHIPESTWQLEIKGLVTPLTWTWEEFAKLPHTVMRTDIHCVTRWSKLDTEWQGVSLDTIIAMAGVQKDATHLIAHSYDGYTTNLPIEDIRNNKALVATAYEGSTIESQHGGPARLFVPHLYFWKSAKWLKALEFTDHDEPGFWETRGYHNYGDPWQEQRYSDD